MNTRDLPDQLPGGAGVPDGNSDHDKRGVASGDLPSGLLSGRGGSALAGAAPGFFPGTGKARRMGGKFAMYGGMAALCATAYRVYGNWQQGMPAASRALRQVPCNRSVHRRVRPI